MNTAKNLISILILLLIVESIQAQEDKSELKDKTFTIENCVNEFNMAGADKTKSGYRYWFADKNFIDGRTIKLSVVRPGQATHEPHVHENDEFFFILEGQAKFHLDGKEKVVGPQTSLYCPSNLPHGISNAGDSDLKYLVIKKYTE
jgi:mannose-6-phosphate isomerase-like protein (cupin superfamily)